MKKMTTAVVKDQNTKTSTRVMYFLYYLTIRAGEIIDWWFPTEYEKLQRKRDPKKGAAIPEKTK